MKRGRGMGQGGRDTRVSEYAVRRLSLYHRILRDMERSGQQNVSSEDLAREGRTNAAQVRKDLSYFGSFGKRGKGYGVTLLRSRIGEILGIDRRWRVVIVGAGRLGSALASYKDFPRLGFDIVAIFDDDESKVGQDRGGVAISPMNKLREIISAIGADLGIVATPASAAKEVADRLVGAGVRGILNFAPVKIQVSKDVGLRNVDISLELEGLTFDVTCAEVADPEVGRR
jgi:redox-sensing transcriptional repressor